MPKFAFCFEKGNERKRSRYMWNERDGNRCCYSLLSAIKMSSWQSPSSILHLIPTHTHIYTNDCILFSTHYFTITTEENRQGE